MKFIQLTPILLSFASVYAQDFCSSAQHSGTSVMETSNKVGSIGDVGYELWSDSGNNSATFYSDGSFSCSFSNAKDYLCRSGLSFDSTQTPDQIGELIADFKLVKESIQNVDYSYVGVYGWTREPLVEYYVVDNWLSQWRPGDWVGEKKHGDFEIDGAQYTVYENSRYGPSIDGDTQFKQYFSIRQEPRECGSINISAHFKKWEELGMKMGKLHEAKVLGEAGSTGSGTSGTADFPYAKVHIGGAQAAAPAAPAAPEAPAQDQNQGQFQPPQDQNQGQFQPPQDQNQGQFQPPQDQNQGQTTAKTLPPVNEQGAPTAAKTLPPTNGQGAPTAVKTLPQTNGQGAPTAAKSLPTDIPAPKALPDNNGQNGQNAQPTAAKTIPVTAVKTLPQGFTAPTDVPGTKALPQDQNQQQPQQPQQPQDQNQGQQQFQPPQDQNQQQPQQPQQQPQDQNQQPQDQNQQPQGQSNSENGNCAGIWGQCGGINYEGPTCCSEGTCKEMNEYFHQCQN